MGLKLTPIFTLFCLLYCFIQIDGTFIKPNNVPRVGRSNEADGVYGQNEMGYVIKTIPNKNIPRMGRRNFDMENRYDIPKPYQISLEDDSIAGQLESYYENQYQNMK